jgi:hypothetical protein
MPDQRLFTPRLSSATLERVNMMLSEEDHALTDHRGTAWTAIITDQLTNKIYLVEGAECGSPGCCCDAVIVAQVNSRSQNIDTMIGVRNLEQPRKAT